mgnify:CR=1 FL=1
MFLNELPLNQGVSADKDIFETELAKSSHNQFFRLPVLVFGAVFPMEESWQLSTIIKTKILNFSSRKNKQCNKNSYKYSGLFCCCSMFVLLAFLKKRISSKTHVWKSVLTRRTKIRMNRTRINTISFWFSSVIIFSFPFNCEWSWRKFVSLTNDTVLFHVGLLRLKHTNEAFRAELPFPT